MSMVHGGDDKSVKPVNNGGDYDDDDDIGVDDGVSENGIDQVFHNESGAPSTTAFVAPSVTTYTDNNPEYRIYEVRHIRSDLHFYENIEMSTERKTWDRDKNTAQMKNKSEEDISYR